MALHGLAPPLRRVFLPSTTAAGGAATAEAAAGHVGGAAPATPRAADADVWHAITQSGAGESASSLITPLFIKQQSVAPSAFLSHASFTNSLTAAAKIRVL